MSKALYRKYRSKSLKEVVGQEHITKTLAAALKSGSVNHAYLFTGPRGVGKTSIARILAHEINKLPYTDESAHLDIIEIDAASNRRIDDIRDLREKVHIAPVSAPYKVYIIDEVHMLTGESFNALLKTLEEPPAHVVFILATTEVHKLPATIISRTQRFHFRPIPADKVKQHLAAIAKSEDITVDDDALDLIAEHGEGSFRDSISLLDMLAAMNGKKINKANVEESLGLAPAKLIDSIISLLTSDNPKELQEVLLSCEEKGVSTGALTAQLLRTLKKQAAEDPRFYNLIDSLLDIHKSTHPQLKLMVTLMQFQKQNSLVITPQSKTASATAVKIPAVSKKPQEIKKKPLAEPQKPEPITEPEPTVAKDAKTFTLESWNDIMQQVKKKNPPLFSVLRHAEPRFNGDTLELAFPYKIHQKKLDEGRYRVKFTEIIVSLGLACPAITTTLDKQAAPPSVTIQSEPVDSTTSSVLAMMGGGEVVNAET